MKSDKKRLGKKFVWRDEFYVKAYELAKTGMSDDHLAKALGVTVVTLNKWKRIRPAFKDAIDKANREVAKSGVSSFLDYVYDRLTPELQVLWDEINACDEEDNGTLRMEALLSRAGTRARQHLFIHALIARNFNASRACRAVNISVGTLNTWMQDPQFSQMIDEIHFHKKNFFEGALIGLVKARDPSAIIFANRTFNRDRGYGDKTTIEHTGQVNHAHAVINVDELDLPLEQRKEILLKLRAKQEAVVAAVPALGMILDQD